MKCMKLCSGIFNTLNININTRTHMSAHTHRWNWPQLLWQWMSGCYSCHECCSGECFSHNLLTLQTFCLSCWLCLCAGH